MPSTTGLGVRRRGPRLLQPEIEKLFYLPHQLALMAGEKMVGTGNLDLRRALESLEHCGARIGLLQHLREIALAVNVEHRQPQFVRLRELAGYDADRNPGGDTVVGRAGQK